MPKNKFGGSGHKKSKRGNRNRVGAFNEESGDYYAKVIKIAGDNKVDVKLHDGRLMQVRIPGRYFRKVWVRPEDLICCTEEEMRWKVDNESERSAARKLFLAHGGTDTLFGSANDEESDEEESDEEDDNDRYQQLVTGATEQVNQNSDDDVSDGDVDISKI